MTLNEAVRRLYFIFLILFFTNGNVGKDFKEKKHFAGRRHMMMYRNDIQLQTEGKGGASPRNSLFVFGTMLRRGNSVCLDINTAYMIAMQAVFFISSIFEDQTQERLACSPHR